MLLSSVKACNILFLADVKATNSPQSPVSTGRFDSSNAEGYELPKNLIWMKARAICRLMRLRCVLQKDSNKSKDSMSEAERHVDGEYHERLNL